MNLDKESSVQSLDKTLDVSSEDMESQRKRELELSLMAKKKADRLESSEQELQLKIDQANITVEELKAKEKTLNEEVLEIEERREDKIQLLHEV